jgi:hypothetical protein
MNRRGQIRPFWAPQRVNLESVATEQIGGYARVRQDGLRPGIGS